MTEKQRIFRNSLLTKIHTHEFYKGCIENEAWSEFLMNNFGVESSAKLSIKELISLLEIMHGSKSAAEKPDFCGRRVVNNKLGTQKQIKKVFVLKNKIFENDMKFINFIYKHTGKILWRLDMLQNMDKKELTKLIVILEKIRMWKKSKEL